MSNGRPKFSVGVLTHNYARFLPAALDSVLAQTFRDFECVICDDASTDETATVVRPYLADPRVRYVRHERNLQQGANWAHFLTNARADRLATLHADDAYEPDALAIATAAFDADPSLDLFTGRWQKVSDGTACIDDVTPIEPADVREGGRAAYIAETRRFTRLPSATFFTRRALQIAGLPRADLSVLVDAEFFLRVTAAATHIGRTSDLVTRYRIHTDSCTIAAADDGRFCDELRRLLDIVSSHPIADAGTVDAMRERVARELYSVGINALLGLKSKSGLKTLAEAGRRWGPLWREPIYVLDRFLANLGPLGRRLGRRVHRHRVMTFLQPIRVRHSG